MPAAIADYALIGDCETAALVDRNGSIDWLCLPRFDSPACFAALLGSPENGRWQLRPHDDARVARRYRPRTLILETEFRTATGKATLIDFMPLHKGNPRIIRIVRGDRGEIRMEMDLAIRFDYGLTVPWVTQQNGLLFAVAGPHRLVLRSSVPTQGRGLHTVADFSVKAGETARFVLLYENSFDPARSRASAKSALKGTETWWRNWAARCRYRGRGADAVQRSLITLKALIYARTGGIVAAPTTSLPEQPSAWRNWDYRYCWVRDATFTLLGLFHTGYHQEARRWKEWLIRAVAGSVEQMQVMYGVTGERLLREWEVRWLQGYKHARPVRVGNAASEQLQLDIYGELFDVLHQARSSAQIRGEDIDFQLAVLEHLEKIWRQPDHGIWEVRGRPRHFTHSKVMVWVAFDRAIRSAERFRRRAPLAKWRVIRQEIHQEICSLGFDREAGSFVQSYGSKQIDASLLLLPLVGFLPPTDCRIRSTVRRIEKELMRRGFVMRYTTDPHDGRPVKEGAFLPCSFWLADYYLLAGRRKAAIKLLERLLKARNDVGLLSEEYDVQNRSLTGNFPQALSHVALINTIISIYTRHGPARQRSSTR